MGCRSRKGLVLLCDREAYVSPIVERQIAGHHSFGSLECVYVQRISDYLLFKARFAFGESGT